MTTTTMETFRDVTRPVGLSRRNQWAFVIFSTWIIAGLFLDGWSHEVRKPETFFTPWHALLYSGFQAAVLWGMWESRRAVHAGVPRDGLDPLSAVGVVMFATGMVGDFVWHALLGIEVNVEGLLSPTHLTLMTAGLLLAATPVRMAMANPAPREAPVATFGVVQSLVAITAVVAFFTQFASAFRGRNMAALVALRGMGDVAETHAVQGVISILLTNALLVGVVAYATSRWTLRPGALTAVVSVPTLAVSGLTSFSHVPLVLAAFAGGLAVEAAVALGRRDLAPIVLALVTWPTWFAIAALTMPFGWSPNVWGGTVFLCALTACGLRVLVTPSPAGA